MIIGLCGKRGSGKNLVAEYCEQTQRSFEFYAFAEPIKKICREVFDLSWDQREGKLKHTIDPRYGKTPRKIFQEIGDSFRSINKDIFIDTLKRKRINRHTHCVIPDCRFFNEAEWIREDGGILVFVNREIERNLDTDEHESECELDSWTNEDYDYVIKNPTPHDKSGLLEETKKMLQHFGLL